MNRLVLPTERAAYSPTQIYDAAQAATTENRKDLTRALFSPGVIGLEDVAYRRVFSPNGAQPETKVLTSAAPAWSAYFDGYSLIESGERIMVRFMASSPDARALTVRLRQDGEDIGTPVQVSVGLAAGYRHCEAVFKVDGPVSEALGGLVEVVLARGTQDVTVARAVVVRERAAFEVAAFTHGGVLSVWVGPGYLHMVDAETLAVPETTFTVLDFGAPLCLWAEPATVTSVPRPVLKGREVTKMHDTLHTLGGALDIGSDWPTTEHIPLWRLVP